MENVCLFLVWRVCLPTCVESLSPIADRSRIICTARQMDCICPTVLRLCGSLYPPSQPVLSHLCLSQSFLTVLHLVPLPNFLPLPHVTELGK